MGATNDKPMETLLQELLDAIPDCARAAYMANAWRIKERVDQTMAARDNLPDLIGANPVQVMHTNHDNHVRFMVSAMTFKSGATFAAVVAWAYRSYLARGFSADYFPAALEAWIDAVREALTPADAAPISALYKALIGQHEALAAQARRPLPQVTAPAENSEAYEAFLAAVLKPSGAEALRVARKHIHSVHDIPGWWEHVVTPAMHRVGQLWSAGAISVGQEHLATAITQRVLAQFYPMILELPRAKGTVVFATSPGELHEIGARIVADVLEIHGWDVLYTGADTPAESAVQLVAETQARVLCVSTTMPYNLPQVADLIAQVRRKKALDAVHVLVGGQAYMGDGELWRRIGADGLAGSASAAVRHLETAV